MGILDGKKLLVTGVLTDDSLAFSAARVALEQGAEIVLTGFGRGLSLTERTARKLPSAVEVLELDVTDAAQGAAVCATLGDKWGRLDGLLHSIGFAPANCLGQGMFAASWEEVATTIEVSAYSLKTLAESFLPLLEAAGGASIVGLDFDATKAWPGYDWMGVAKAALESLARYLARDLGPKQVRVNLVAAGPIRTMAAKSIPGFSLFEETWNGRAPLGWDVRGDQDAVGMACAALLSDLFPKTTGEILHVDGGYHALGA
ncbi:MAG TPA: enoyl-ACP reductase FabI [Acidimicrobiales bacterium]|nr:enoyl-ACP reductase FabI [Acidimicrobiales bacterium]